MKRLPSPLIIWHKPHGKTYAWANSRFGRVHAQRNGCNARDVDLRMTADGVLIATHEGWGVNEFKMGDPRKRRWRQVRRWRMSTGFPHRIWSAAATLRLDTSKGMTPCFEAKPEPRLKRAGNWMPLIRAARRNNVVLVVMAQPKRGHGIAMLKAAKQAGGNDVFTILLARGPVSKATWDVVDAAKGRRWLDLNKPAGKVRLGPGSKAGRSKIA